MNLVKVGRILYEDDRVVGLEVVKDPLQPRYFTRHDRIVQVAFVRELDDQMVLYEPWPQDAVG